jgi:membrane-associated phospholipid phosphatase
MPSSHTAYACVMAVFLGRLYPRLRWVVWSLAAVVGLARVVTNAHYVTDVVVGGAIGLIVIRVALARDWGEALLGIAGKGRAGAQPPETQPAVSTVPGQPAEARMGAG